MRLVQAIAVIFLCCAWRCVGADPGILKATRAGQWYPATAEALTQAIRQHNFEAQNCFAMPVKQESVRAIIVPHAGYRYSGSIAAAAYRCIDAARIDRVILLVPCHFTALTGIVVSKAAAYETALGAVKLMPHEAHVLVQRGGARYEDAAFFAQEHSLEVQMPMIQTFAPKAAVIPIMVGSLTSEDAERLGRVMRTLITPTTLVVATSDMTHYGERFSYKPYATDVLRSVQRDDAQTLAAIQHQDMPKFKELMTTAARTMCGAAPAMLLMQLIAQGALGSGLVTRLVAYGTSVDAEGVKGAEPESCVSYASLIVTSDPHLDRAGGYEQRELLRYVREVLEQRLSPTKGNTPLRPISTLVLERPCGAFVTLTTRGKSSSEGLRGCIGQVMPTKPFIDVIDTVTVDAALHDHRFAPVQYDELARIDIEISMLTQPRAVASYRDIVLDTHGVILTKNGATALFLPQVARENGFDRDTLLRQLSLKAGLPKDAWKDAATKFSVFEAQAWNERTCAACTRARGGRLSASTC